MKRLIGMMALVLSMAFFGGCSGSGVGSGDDGGAGPGSAKALKFTSDMLVGKTYRATDDEGTFTVTFHEDGTLTFETEDGETGTLTYSIDEDGRLIIEDEGEDDIHILVSIDENGNLRVENDGIVIDWEPVSGDNGEEDPALKFTYELLVGKSYKTADDEGTVTVTFDEYGNMTFVADDGTTGTLSYTIDEEGRLVIAGYDFHILISIDDNGNLRVLNDGDTTLWELVEDEYGEDPGLRFTDELLVGKTYRATDDEGTFTVTFHEDGTLTFETEDGETGTLPYSIDEDGHLVIEDEGEVIVHILISINDDGSLSVENNGTVIVWELVEDEGSEEPAVVFTYELLVGNAYDITDEEGTVTVTFSEDEMTYSVDGETGTLPYTIDEEGRLVIDGTDIHILISIEENGNLQVENEGMVSEWILPT